MEARVSNDLQAIDRNIKESDEKSSSILLLEEKLIHDVYEFDLEAIRLQQQLKLCEEKITDAKKRQLAYKDFPLLDAEQEDLIKALDDMDMSKSVITFDENLASACQLSPEEKNAWAVRSNALYGSYLNPVSYMRSFLAWSGKDSYIRRTPLIGEYIAGPSSVSPVSVMLRLTKILADSIKKRIANQDFSNAKKEIERLEEALQDSKSFRQVTQIEVQRIQALNTRIADYDRVMSLTTEFIQDPFLYLEALLKAKNKITDIRCTKHQGFELLVKEREDKVQAEINAATKTIMNQYDHIADSEIRYHNLLESRKEMRRLGARIPNELYFKIQKLRVQKAWDTTYEVHKFGEEKREFKHYFLGFPQYLGLKKSFVFSWFLYTIGCGFLFTPIKNTLKLFTEAFPKIMDAHCENNLEKTKYSKFASVGHYIFKGWWLVLRPMTSPVVSLKAAWNSYHNYDNKYAAWGSRLILSGLSLTLSLAAIFTAIVVVPKVALGLLGEAGGVVTAAATAADSAILSAVPVTYANVAATLRGAVGIGLDRSSSAEVAKRMALHKNHKPNTMPIENISSMVSKGVDEHISSHYDQLPESKSTNGSLRTCSKSFN